MTAPFVATPSWLEAPAAAGAHDATGPHATPRLHATPGLHVATGSLAANPPAAVPPAVASPSAVVPPRETSTRPGPIGRPAGRSPWSPPVEAGRRPGDVATGEPAPFVAKPSIGLPAGADAASSAEPWSAEPWSADPWSVGSLSAVPVPADASPDAEPSSRQRLAPPPPHDLSVLGPLEPFADDPAVTDLFVNGAAGLWVDRGAGAEPEPAWHADEAEVRALAVRLIARGGRHIDEATPAVDVRLGRGIRVHAVLPPVSSTGTLISVRIPRAAGFSLAELAEAGMLDADQLAGLQAAVAERRNLLVTGAGGTGKTTLLGALLSAAPEGERIVVIEDVAELSLAHPHVVSLEARQPNLEGSGRVGLDALLREALRMRPDRLVVGECRGAELRELLSALNTGHDGGAGTLHANSLDDVPARLEALGSTAGMSAEAVGRQTVSAFDLVLHLERREGRRALAAVGRFRLAAGSLAVEAL